MRPLALLLVALLLSLASALELIFLDVGQGDAVVIRSPTGQTVLYDAGEANVLGQLQALGIERLDLVIASHAHADHIGGMAEVIRHYRPRFYLDNGVPHTTRTYERTLEAVLGAGSQLLEPTARRISLGDVTLQILPPPGIAAWGHNNNSIGVIVEYGAFRASLMGDAEPEQWAWWLANHRGLLPQVQVHKSSHHGSRNGDTREGIRALEPEVVVISAGTGNRYGHPHREALALYAAVDAQVYRTDLHGRITVTANQDGTFQVVTEQGAAPPPAAAAQCVDINRAGIEALRQIVHIDTARA